MKKINKILLIISIFIFTFAFKVNAAETLIEIKNKIIVTTDTTVEDIIKVLGEPKVKTISPFGGYAYTFYTDNNYSNYLYIETTVEDKIISYGSVDKNYIVPGVNNNGATLVVDNNNLSGYFYTDDNNKIIGGIYYNPSVLEEGNTDEIIHFYNTNYDLYSTEYQNGIARHAIPMYNALAKRLNKNVNLQYSDALNYYYSDNSKSEQLGWESLEVKELAFSKLTTSVLNPMYYASMLKNNLNRDYSKNNVPLFGYDKKNQKIYGYIATMDEAEQISYEDVFQFYQLDGNAGEGYSFYFNKPFVYALNLLDDKMSETEKALVLAQFSQLNIGTFDYDPSNVSQSKLRNWYNNYFQTLATTAGLSCEVLENEDSGNVFNICNLDNEWTYIDVSKTINSFEPYHTKIKFDLLFKSKATIEKSNTLNSKYNFSKSVEVSTYNYSENPNPLFAQDYPEGVDKKIDDYSSLVYYDDSYKYYLKTENKKTYIYKENRDTHEVEKLQEALYRLDGSGLVKDNDDLYYIGVDKVLYSYNLKTKTSKNIFSLNEEGKEITGVLLNEKGFISYEVYEDSTQKSELRKTDIRVSNWPKEKVYYFDDNNYKYKLLYLETPKNISIIATSGFGEDTVKGNLKIPDTINNKPVVGLIGVVIAGAMPVDEVPTFYGDFIAPKYLEYISKRIFGISNESVKFDNIKLNSKLKSIGSSVFQDTGCLKTISIPDSVTYVGPDAFYFGLSDDVDGFKLGSGLKYINHYAFYNNVDRMGYKLTKFKVPEGVEYIADDSIPIVTIYYYPKSLIRSSDNTYHAKEIFYYSNKTKFECTICDSYYITPDFTDIVEMREISDIYSHEFSFDKKTFSFNKYDIEVKPKYFFDETHLTWSSSDESVAEVDNDGNVNFKNPGSTTIKLTSSNGGETSYEIKIIDLIMNHETWQFNNYDETIKLSAHFTEEPTEHEDTGRYFSSSNSVVSVDQEGNVVAQTGGFSVVRVSSDYYGSAECLIYVNLPLPLEDGSSGFAGDFNRDSKIDMEDVTILENIVKKGDYTNDERLLGDVNGNYTLDDDDVEKLKYVVANKSFTVGPYKPIKSISLNATQLNLPVGSYIYLEAQFNPTDTTDSTRITWSSSNNTVASVNEWGEIRTLKDGITTITATTKNGKTAKCILIVGNAKLDYKEGDINGNNTIEVADAIEALKYYVEIYKPTEYVLKVADFNGNNKIDVSDAIKILNLYVSE